MQKTQSKVVLVTGASSGFGDLIAKELHGRSHRVYGTSRNPAKHSVPFEMVEMDLQSEDSIRQTVDQVIANEGRIDTVLNNAGLYMAGFLEESSLEQVRHLYETNLFGIIAVIQKVLPHMRKQRSGHIINVTSIAGLISLPGVAPYSSTKHAMEGITKGFAYEVEQFGIKVSIVKPGNFKTGASQAMAVAEKRFSDYDSHRDALVQKHADLVNFGADPKILSKAVVKLIESKRPKLHNVVGPYAKVAPWLQMFPSLLRRLSTKELALP